MGTGVATLTVLPPPVRTVLLTGKPQANVSDTKPLANVGSCGNCRSLAYPPTAAATAAAEGVLTPMPCVPSIVGPWFPGKLDYLVQGPPALLKSDHCQCAFGGTISLINDGQTPTGPADLSRMPKDDFEIRIELLTAPSIGYNNTEYSKDNSGKKYADETDGNSSNTATASANTSVVSPTSEAEKHLKQLLQVKAEDLKGMPKSWIKPYNDAIKNIKANYSKNGLQFVYSDVELAHNIYSLATSRDAQNYGLDKLSYKMPHQMFNVEDKVPGFIDNMPTKDFWDSFETYIPLYTDTNDDIAHFSPLNNCVIFPMNNEKFVNRLKKSDWYKAGIVHHEFGHAYDYAKGWRTDKEFKDLYNDFKNEMNSSNITNNLSKYIDDKGGVSKLSADELEKLGKLSDCLQAATDGHARIPPSGHKVEYFQSEDKQMAEFIAHMSENYWSGNDLFESLAPETYRKGVELLKKRWGADAIVGQRMPSAPNFIVPPSL